MYRRGDPRWNRTIQHITDNLEHANESAQENIYGFTQSYISPCFSSITQCVNACTAPCFPSHNDRRRHRGRSRGRAELSFDFYDDWENDETDGLLGWGNDNLDRLMGGAASSYGATTQPGRQATMAYGQRSRDPRYNTSRRKSADVGPDPTIIPSSSYFGFLGRLPFKVGGKGLRYKPSAADLVDHPGAARRSVEEQPLIEDSDEDAQDDSESKGHRRQRSGTHTSGHTTDSLSSRGDIFPSEDEIDDAVPLDDEFAMALERRTTGQWNDEASSHKDKARSSSRQKSNSSSKQPSTSRISSHTASSRNTQGSSRRSTADDITVLQRSPSRPMQESNTTDPDTDTDTLADLQREEERLRIQEEAAIQQKRQDAHNLAVKRGLQTPSPSPSLKPLPPPPNRGQGQTQSQTHNQMSTLQPHVSPLVRSPASETTPFPSFSNLPSISARTLSVDETPGEGEEDFVPARLPSFGGES